MDENLDAYNDDAVHDMWVDSDYNENTGELPYVEDKTYYDNDIDNLIFRANYV